MATNLSIDPDLLQRAYQISGLKTKKAAVTEALKEYIARREQARILDLFGKMKCRWRQERGPVWRLSWSQQTGCGVVVESVINASLDPMDFFRQPCDERGKNRPLF